MTAPTGYPERWESHAVLKDGATVELRPIRADDRDAVGRFHKRQSKESIYFRFFRYHPDLTDKELDYFTKVDYRDRMAFVALLGHELVAVARYERLDGGPAAEVAFFVDDQHHGRGVATLLLEYLAAAGREQGLSRFTASVLPENYGMLAVFRSAGFEAKTRFVDGLIEVDLDIEVTSESSAKIVDRGRRSNARSIARLLEPASVAVIGASRAAGHVGHELIRSLLGPARSSPLANRIYPVTPNADEVAGVVAYPTISAATAALAADMAEPAPDSGEPTETAAVVGDRLASELVGVGQQFAIESDGRHSEVAPNDPVFDLAVVAVRADLTPSIVAECADAGVRSLLIVSTGAEGSGPDGMELTDLVELVRDNGMRMIGPGSFGLVNTNETIGLSALFHHVATEPGSVALASESGPLGAALLERMAAAGLGLSSFVGVTNRSDVSVNDLLDYWDLDRRTDVILLYVENYGNLANFATVARRVSTSKPIVAVAPADPNVRELLGQTGVIIVDEVGQLADQAQLAANQPVATGRRVVIVSNTASVARLTADACRRNGLEVVVPSTAMAATTGTGRDLISLTDHAVLIGDLDTTTRKPSSDPGDYEPIIVACGASDSVDLVLVALVPTSYLGPVRLAQILNRVNRSIDKPVVAVGLVSTDRIVVERLPTFVFPEEAARALAGAARYGEWQAAHTGGGHSDERASSPASDEVVDEVLAGRSEARLTMSSHDMTRVVDELGIPLAPYGIARGFDEVLALADRIGYPVVIKAGNLSRRAIGESRGAAIDLHDADALRSAYHRMEDVLGVAMRSTVVQRMVTASDLARIDLRQDPSFGSMISIGLGGSHNAAKGPVARRFLPVDRESADELVDALAQALSAEDNPDPVDESSRAALIELVLSLDAAAAATPRLAAAALNPVMLSGAETVPVDVQLVLRSQPADSLAGVRHL